MSDLSTPHDSFFKQSFSNPEVAADLLRHYLPSDLVASFDFNTLQPSKDSFVDEDLRSHFSDLLYKVNLGTGGDAYIYVLFEHKSSQDEWVAFQLLRYMLKIWEHVRKQNPRRESFLQSFPWSSTMGKVSGGQAAISDH
jgi:predicted transposase/invertase (TIGR01784 family)